MYAIYNSICETCDMFNIYTLYANLKNCSGFIFTFFFFLFFYRDIRRINSPTIHNIQSSLEFFMKM